MSVDIRQIQESDYNEIFELFEKRKKDELLRWVYNHPCGSGNSAYVALKEGEIAGVVGYVRSLYYLNGAKKTGLIPLSWEVKKEHRGIIGIRLIKKALSDADFFLGMDGSEDMRNIFKGLHFREIGRAFTARKVLLPFRYLKTLKKIGPRDIYRYMLNILRTILSERKQPSLTLEPIDFYDSYDNDVLPGFFYNPVSSEHLQWLRMNPGMRSFVFRIKIDNKFFGPIILFIKDIRNGITRGQIAHIPPLPTQYTDYFIQIIRSIEFFFISQNVTAITTLVTNPDLKSAFSNLNYKFDKKSRPIVIKGEEDILESFENATIHLSFAESDKSVRNI